MHESTWKRLISNLIVIADEEGRMEREINKFSPSATEYYVRWLCVVFPTLSLSFSAYRRIVKFPYTRTLQHTFELFLFCWSVLRVSASTHERARLLLANTIFYFMRNIDKVNVICRNANVIYWQNRGMSRTITTTSCVKAFCSAKIDKENVLPAFPFPLVE